MDEKKTKKKPPVKKKTLSKKKRRPTQKKIWQYISIDFDPHLEQNKPQDVDVGGRPRAELDLTDELFLNPLKDLCKIQSTATECADFFDVSVDTLDRRIKDIGYKGFAEFFKRHCSSGKRSLRRMQMQSANEGNVTMQIFLGKNMLGQRDKTENWDSEGESFEDDASLTPDPDPISDDFS